MAAMTFQLQRSIETDFDDPELLARVGWRNSVDRRLACAAADGDVHSFAAALRRHAGIGRKLRPSLRFSDDCDVFLQPLWSLRAFVFESQAQRLTSLLGLFARTASKPDRRTAARISRRVLNELETLDATAQGQPLVQLGWLTILAWGSRFLDDDALTRLWLHALRQTLRRAAFDADPDDPSLTDDQQILLQGELPFLAGLVFQEIRGSRRMVRRGEQQLRNGLEQGTDNDGTPHSRLLNRFSLWLSPFCRAAVAGRRFNRAWWNRPSARRFSDLVLRSAALTRSDGELALANGVALAPASLLKTASSLTEFEALPQSQSFVDSVANDVTRLTQRGKTPRKNAVKPTSAARPRRNTGRQRRSNRPASQSDWARLACLRNNWDLGADACVIAYDADLPRIDLTALGTAVISGVWELRSSLDGANLASEADWECVCWFSDRDVDYVELQRQDSRATLLRQAMLSRTDHFLYLADNLLSASDSTGRVEHSFQLPLVGAAGAARDALTREWLLKIGSLKVRLLPISIQQDATVAAAGELSVTDAGIRLQRSSAGPNLMSSLVLDWSPVRRRDGAFWQALTVAEDGRSLSPSEAAGIHLRIGGHQWLFYRSLVTGQTARSVLGQHTANETLIGELDSGGDLDPLIIVEGGQEPHEA